jgi:tetratricopeptide (TPR) repeat protein
MVPTMLDEAKALVLKGDVDAAMRKLTGFLNGDFFNEEALFMLGNCFMSGGMHGLAAVVTSAAIDARATRGQHYPEALLNLGGSYKTARRNDVAEKIWLEALKHEPLPRRRTLILSNIAGLYVNEGQPEKAIEWCDLALKEDPQNHGAAAQRGMACLELGRWREGWEGWKHTYASHDRRRRNYGDHIPEWTGTMGQRVIVYGDQGVGDEIYYASCLADMAQVCRSVILDCHPRLDKLFARSFPEFEVHGTRKDLTELPWLRDCGAEAAIALADLPGHFRNRNSEWGDGRAYLKAEGPGIVVGARPGPRIGISWTGGTRRTRSELRSIPIEALEPILRARPDAQWFSLQYTPDKAENQPDAARQVCELEERTGIRISHYPGWVECFDYDRTASFVASLDLVITVPTTVHHLAGSIGVPVWTLVPSRPSWRYQIKGERLPWYASARLFRQDADGDWSGPIARVAKELGCL